MEDGLGDTIRVSLTEDPELEIPVCRDIVKRYEYTDQTAIDAQQPLDPGKISYSPFEYKRRETFSVDNIGGKHVPVVIADLSKINKITPAELVSVGYTYDEGTDKWNISDAAADYIFTGKQVLDFALPGTLKVLIYPDAWRNATDKTKYFPLFDRTTFSLAKAKSPELNFVMIDCSTGNEHLIHFATETGALLLDGFGDGMCLGMTSASYDSVNNQQASMNASGRNYLQNQTPEQFINNTAFSILQATRTRISKTEYISCPSCGRTLFDLQETTARIRSVTNHLKGVKIAIMGCIVNGPGEMADADFGYVGSGPGKITLYRGKEVVKRGVDSAIAVAELINLLQVSEAWVEPSN